MYLILLTIILKIIEDITENSLDTELFSIPFPMPSIKGLYKEYIELSLQNQKNYDERHTEIQRKLGEESKMKPSLRCSRK